jgi:hypothetical protein
LGRSSLGHEHDRTRRAQTAIQRLDVVTKSTSDDTLISKVRLWLLWFTPFASLPAVMRETPFRETPFRETVLVGALAGTW